MKEVCEAWSEAVARAARERSDRSGNDTAAA